MGTGNPVVRKRRFFRSAVFLVEMVLPVLLAGQQVGRSLEAKPNGAAQPPAFSGAATGSTPATGETATATLIGTVKDANGNVLEGAAVTLTNAASKEQHAVVADTNGFFDLSVPPGQYVATVSSPGLATWTSGAVAVDAGDYREIAGIVLKVNTAVSIVRVTPSQEQIAEEQIKDEEHQRIGGMFPNFYVSYVPNAAPLTARQKFQLAWKSSIDPFSFVADGLTSGVEQAENQYSAYGQGMKGYAQRFGAAYAGDATGNFIGGAILPVIFRQDPRYYYRGTGSVFARAAYAVSTIAICKGDNGRWQPNYSFVLGNFASGAISNLYYPAANRGWGTTLENGAVSTLMGTTGALLQEFVLRRFSRGVPGKNTPGLRD